MFLADNQGFILACSSLQAGQHHGIFPTKQGFEEHKLLLKEAGIESAGLFLNADTDFKSQDFRQQCSEMKKEVNIALNARNTANIEICLL